MYKYGGDGAAEDSAAVDGAEDDESGIGSISATPIAAERPGRQPMTMPRDTPPTMAKRFIQVRALTKP